MIVPITFRRQPRVPDDGYQESDGKPVGETPLHRDNLLYLVHVLQMWFQADPQVYVSGNMFMYYEKDNRDKSVVPDVFVVRGIPRLPERRVFKTWVEGRNPDLVIELTSRKTKREDQKDKLELYRDVLKVREYVLYDPEADYLQPPLQAYRLRGGKYVRIAEKNGRVPSTVLKLHYFGQAGMLRLWNPAQDEVLPLPSEYADRDEIMRRENQRLKRRAAFEKRQVEIEKRRADDEKRRADRAEAEAAQLRAELDRLRRGGRLPPT
jgi:Uma2 family endonuclease